MFPIIKDNKSTWPWVTPKLLLTCLQAWRGHEYFMKSRIILAICSIQKKKIILTFNFQIHFTFRQITNFSFKSSDFTIFSILISRFNLKMIPVLHEFHSLNLMKPQQSCNYTRDFSRQITNFSFKFSDFTIFSISNFQIHFENDPGAALVSFAQPNEATAAMQLYARFFWSNHKFQF